MFLWLRGPRELFNAKDESVSKMNLPWIIPLAEKEAKLTVNTFKSFQIGKLCKGSQICLTIAHSVGLINQYSFVKFHWEDWSSWELPWLHIFFIRCCQYRSWHCANFHCSRLLLFRAKNNPKHFNVLIEFFAPAIFELGEKLVFQ